MDTAWIQVFLLTIAECVAPAGKSVCQEREFELQFLTEADCRVALEQLVTLKEGSANVIVDRDRSGCAPGAREAVTYASLEAINAAHRDTFGWRSARPDDGSSSSSGVDDEGRLAGLQTCEETGGVTPCKVGEIIIEEGTGEPVEIWRRDQ